MKYVCLVVMVIVNLAIAPIAVMASAKPELGQPIIVISAPWSGGADNIVARAGGQLVGPVQAPLASMTIYETDTYIDRLHEGGAWFVLSGAALSFLCEVGGVA